MGLESIAGEIRAPWFASGSRATSDAVLHAAGKQSTAPANTQEPVWDDIRNQMEWFRNLYAIRRAARSENLRLALARLDAEYGPSRQEAARAAQKDEFETTPQYLARTTEARAAAAAIEVKYKPLRDRLDTIFKDPTGDPNLKVLESLKSQRFRGPCRAIWGNYDADQEVLTLFVGGADREFSVPIEAAKELKPRSSRLTCEGGFTPETVAVSDPARKVKLIENPPPKGLPLNTPGLTRAHIVFRVEPEYSETARQLRVQGAVVLKLVVDSNGLPRAIRVMRPLGYGLDEKAVAAVQKWRFEPGMKDGEKVATEATVEMNFRLL